jgi:hypothetical protein
MPDPDPPTVPSPRASGTPLSLSTPMSATEKSGFLKRMVLRRPAILAYFPRLRWRDEPPPLDLAAYDPVLYDRFPEDVEAACADDVALLRRFLIPHFVAEDREALRAQNEFRRDQVVLIMGGVVATGLAALPGEAHWAGWKVAAAIWTAFLATWAARSRDLSAQARWRTCRLKAELLRGEYFLFLARAKPYDDDACRARNLKKRVAEIRSGGDA